MGSEASGPELGVLLVEDSPRIAERVRELLQDAGVRVLATVDDEPSAIRALQAIGLEITTIKDCTPVPHNGCRPRQKRRV